MLAGWLGLKKLVRVAGNGGTSQRAPVCFLRNILIGPTALLPNDCVKIFDATPMPILRAARATH